MFDLPSSGDSDEEDEGVHNNESSNESPTEGNSSDAGDSMDSVVLSNPISLLYQEDRSTCEYAFHTLFGIHLILLVSQLLQGAPTRTMRVPMIMDLQIDCLWKMIHPLAEIPWTQMWIPVLCIRCTKMIVSMVCLLPI
jgi:hypothetical protein